jgi:protein-tyrosine phosphatase
MLKMIRILFVCHGNICRSHTAEFVMKDIVERVGYSNEIFVTSAAITSEEIGNDIYPNAKAKPNITAGTA